MTVSEGAGREQQFWDEHVPSLADCLTELRNGPDPNTDLMFRAIEPLEGARVLDFACGAGVTSAWLAQRGAHVTGVDVSPASVERAREVAKAAGATATFAVGSDLCSLDLDAFDRMVGRFALHHVDVAETARALSQHLVEGGVAAFLETMDSNPLLRVARRHLVGRFGIPRLGTLDEHPLTRSDLEVLRREFGRLRLDVVEMNFLRILDRQVLQYRWDSASRLLATIDDLLLSQLGWMSGSYHQVLVLEKSL